MSLVPEVRFTRSGNVDLAYQVLGDGPLDLLVMIGWVAHLEVLWELPECRRFVERLAGMAVNIGARVAALASPGEVVVSQTIRDMVIGSMFHLTPRGRHQLKGVPGTWGDLWCRHVKLPDEISRSCRCTVNAFVGGVWAGARCPSQKGLS